MKNIDKSRPFKDESYSEKEKTIWPEKYDQYVDDYYIVVRVLHLCGSKDELFNNYQISEFLTEYSKSWSFERFVGAFLFHQTDLHLKRNNSVLTAHHWEKVIQFMLHPGCFYTVKNLVEKNDFFFYSKKNDILEGAALAIGKCIELVNCNPYKPLPYIEMHHIHGPFYKGYVTTLERVFDFLNINKKEQEVLVESLLSDKNTNKIVSFLKNREWYASRTQALKTGTEYLRNLSLKKEELAILFDSFIKSQREQLTDFDVFGAFNSFEENVTKISTLSLLDSYFVFFTDFMANPRSDLLKIFEFFEVRIYSSSKFFKDGNPYFSKSDLESDLLTDLNTLSDLPTPLTKEDPSFEKINTFIQIFMNEASRIFEEENEDLAILIESTTLNNVKVVSRQSFVSFLLISGLIAVVMSNLRGLNRAKYLESYSSAPFATIGFSTASVRPLPITLVRARIARAEAPAPVAIAKQSKVVYERNLLRQEAKNLELSRSQPLKTITSPTSKKIQLNTNDKRYHDAKILIEAVNDAVVKYRLTNGAARPKLQFGQLPNGDFDGRVNLYNFVGTHSTNKKVVKFINFTIQKNNLNFEPLSYLELDHYLTTARRQSYAFGSNMDTAISTGKLKAHHQTTTAWSQTNNSRVDANNNYTKELMYESKVTADLLLDHEHAGKTAATKTFLKTLYSEDQLAILDTQTQGTGRGITGEQLLEMEGSSGQEALQAEWLACHLTRKQISEKISTTGKNARPEQQILADCRLRKIGNLRDSQFFKGLQTTIQAEENLKIYGNSTSEAILDFKNAQNVCHPDGQAYKEITDFISQTKTNFEETIKNRSLALNNFEVPDNVVISFLNPPIPSDLSLSALDQRALDSGVLTQDKNRTGCFFNHRSEKTFVIATPELQDDPMVQSLIEFEDK